jgi:AraC-like DNA-binding protein
MVSSCGHQHVTSPGYDWHGRRRGSAEFALLQHTVAGEGRLTVGERPYRVRPGDTMLLHFPQDNRYWLPPESPHWTHLYLCVHGRAALEVWRQVTAVAGPLVRLQPTGAALTAAVELIHTGLAGGIDSPFRSSALAYQLAMALADELLPTGGASARPPPVERAMRYARERFRASIGVPELAAEAGYSRAHFTRLFTAAEGLSPADYLRHVRVEAAARLLQTSRLSLDEIATQCGFNDGAYLAKVFRRAFGMTPTAFRRSGM